MINSVAKKRLAETRLYDVRTAYNQALKESRQARGEPNFKAGRWIWKTGRWAGQNPLRTASTLLSLTALVLLVFEARRVSREMDRELNWRVA